MHGGLLDDRSSGAPILSARCDVHVDRALLADKIRCWSAILHYGPSPNRMWLETVVLLPALGTTALMCAVLNRATAGGPQTDDRLADQAVLARVARGDHDAFADLYGRHARPVYSLALRILQDRAEAEDIVQEVFSQAWVQSARYDATRGPVVAWLLTLTRSRAIDRLRTRRARPDMFAGEQVAADLTDPSATPDLQVVSTEQVGYVRAALDKLPLLQRIALELAYYEGLTHAEIAERLEQPLGTVKTRIRQAMITLRESLAGTL